jgi:drug/metabolite transporter (DMT)-like permease
MPPPAGPARRPLDGFAVAVMLILCVCWGLQQVAVKVAAPSINPVMQIGARSALAALLVGTLMLWRGTGISLSDGTFWPGIAAGLLFAVEFLCVSLGLTYTTASHMAVFLYTAPIFTAVGLHVIVAGEQLRAGQWLGVGIAFAGIALAFSADSGQPSAQAGNIVLGDSLGILAGALWAATTLVIRGTALAEAPPTTTLLYQLVGAAVLLLTVAVGAGQANEITMTGIAWLSLAFQSVIVAFASFLTWFWMLRRYLASRLSVFSFLTPLFGVGFGVLLLGEPLEGRFALGALCVLVGIVLVNLR